MSKHFVKRDGGSFERKEFSIAGSAEAYRILSDGMYSKKIEAIIRELSTNAVDSHILSNVDDVFEVHLPSFEEPWFYVRDFGSGLSHDDVMNLYSTYFGTNKLGDGQTTGSLGLGSKSPLAKVRSFTVISRHDGVERHYIVALNEDRIPEVNYLPEQDKNTTKTGMEIQIAVETCDIKEYEVKAEHIYGYFHENQRPRIVNCPTYSIVEKEVLIEGNGWRMYGGGGSPVAVQGNVGYPISHTQIQNIDPHHLVVLSGHLEIDFPLDSLKFTPSRENLTYDRVTCLSLSTKLDEIVKEVNSIVIKRFEVCKTLWEARVLLWTMFWSTNADLLHLKNLANTRNITWQGHKIGEQRLSFSDIEGVEGWSFSKYKRTYRGWNNDKIGSITRVHNKDYRPRSNVMWFEVDLPRGSFSRCQQYVRDNQDTTVYLVDFNTPVARQEFCDKMGLAGNEFVLTSTLPKPVYNRNNNSKFPKSTSLVYKHEGGSHRRLYEYWTEAEVDLEDGNGGVYVEMKYNKCVNEKGVIVIPDAVTIVMNLIHNVKGEKIEVIGVRPQVAKQFRKSDDWVDIWTYARKLVQIEVIQKKLAQHIVNAETLRDMENSVMWKSLITESNRRSLGVIHSDGVMGNLIESLTHLQESTDKCKYYDRWRELANRCHVNLDIEPERKPNESVQTMCREYPLIEQIVKLKTRTYCKEFSNEETNALKHYISLVENTGLTNGSLVV